MLSSILEVLLEWIVPICELIAVIVIVISVGTAFFYYIRNLFTPSERDVKINLSDLHAEAARVDVAGLPVGQRIVFPVSQEIVRAQAVHRRAARLAGKHRFQAIVDGGVKGDLSVGIVVPHEIILHAVVLIDRKMLRRLLGEFAPVDQLLRRRGHGAGLIDAVELGIKNPSPTGSTTSTSPELIPAIIAIAFVADVGDGEVRFADGLQNNGNNVLHRAVHIAVLIRVAVRQIVLHIPDAQRRVTVHPRPFDLRKRAGGDADGIKLRAQRAQIGRFIRRQKRLGAVQLCQQIGAGFADAEIIIRRAEDGEHLRVGSPVGAVALRGEDVHGFGIEGVEQLRALRIG